MLTEILKLIIDNDKLTVEAKAEMINYLMNLNSKSNPQILVRSDENNSLLKK